MPQGLVYVVLLPNQSILYFGIHLQELEKAESAALRNNIVVMMADFCVRYTALVDW